MKYLSNFFLFSLSLLTACSQKTSNTPKDVAENKENENTLLWKISGNGLTKPSYLFGTMHMLCADDAVLSNNLKNAIAECDDVYLEVDMDNMMEMFGALGKMKMRGDTTLKDLLSESEYEKVKKYFNDNNTMMPFGMLQTFKPLLAASMLEQNSLPCEKKAMMEQVIMEEAEKNNKDLKGLETMAYQAGVLDSIPYKLQAQQLVQYIDSATLGDTDNKQLLEMFDAYRNQDLKKLEAFMIDTDAGLASFTDILLYQRNANWVTKLREILPEKSLVIAVGAGHLPGEKGVINLLRKGGYKVSPVENKIKAVKEI
ncbi:MAG TPA: TraB/GumN family protein [Chitinophagaceae bacterium]|jgi:uncharacterized protein YbaP (TraB family)|nr:TraB/GumN family protein [Chitinophagaceae bacterium]